VEGNLHAKGRVEIHAAGKFYGNLLTSSLIINEGGIFEGHCKMEEALDQEGPRPLISHQEEPAQPV
jgi:cytoskeletal protein CcmA (bactofilin family)